MPFQSIFTKQKINCGALSNVKGNEPGHLVENKKGYLWTVSTVLLFDPLILSMN